MPWCAYPCMCCAMRCDAMRCAEMPYGPWVWTVWKYLQHLQVVDGPACLQVRRGLLTAGTGRRNTTGMANDLPRIYEVPTERRLVMSIRETGCSSTYKCPCVHVSIRLRCSSTVSVGYWRTEHPRLRTPGSRHLKLLKPPPVFLGVASSATWSRRSDDCTVYIRPIQCGGQYAG